MDHLAAIVGLLVALSTASERLVEILKGFSKGLDEKCANPDKERTRKQKLQTLAVAAGIATTLLARPAIPAALLPDSGGVFPLLALGLLASGGSGLWNSVLTYVLKVKDIKNDLATITAAKAQIATDIAKASSDVGQRADAVARLGG